MCCALHLGHYWGRDIGWLSPFLLGLLLLPCNLSIVLFLEPLALSLLLGPLLFVVGSELLLHSPLGGFQAVEYRSKQSVDPATKNKNRSLIRLSCFLYLLPRSLDAGREVDCGSATLVVSNNEGS
jgi:hypothetical protein